MPSSNVETQLEKLSGESVDLPEPRSRVELYLAKLNGKDVDLPEPQSRVEKLLYNLAKNPSGGDSDFTDKYVKTNRYGLGLFNGLSNLKIANIPSIDYSSIIDFTSMFELSGIDVAPQINAMSGTNFIRMFSNCSSLTSVPQINAPKGKKFNSMFEHCSKLTEISGSNLSTPNGYDFSRMLCTSGIVNVSNLDISNGLNFQQMFDACGSLKTVSLTSTSKGTNFRWMFRSCGDLQTISSELDFGNATMASNILAFGKCYHLKNITIKPNSIKFNFSVSDSQFLTDQSVQSIIDGLATVETACKVTFTDNIVEKLTAEQTQQIIDKNWTVG